MALNLEKRLAGPAGPRRHAVGPHDDEVDRHHRVDGMGRIRLRLVGLPVQQRVVQHMWVDEVRPDQRTNPVRRGRTLFRGRWDDHRSASAGLPLIENPQQGVPRLASDRHDDVPPPPDWQHLRPVPLSRDPGTDQLGEPPVELRFPRGRTRRVHDAVARQAQPQAVFTTAGS
ncbi:hypothetical protein [Actinacidiphila glaucinigra]|uniref:hypothetical protein n=1 Tax=Actinacidiphila glaucinigra TaxID=235986 RepID=UPI0029B4BDB0|nr:hypothetical protein [Streptomyces sp. PA03-3a]